MSDSATPWTAAHTPGFPVHHQLPELTQSHVHRVRDAIQPSHSVSSPSPPSFNLSQNQGLIQWVGSSNQVAKVLEFQLQHHSFQWIFRTDFLWDGLIGSPCSLRDSQETSPTSQFYSINPSVLSFLYSPTLTSMLLLLLLLSRFSCVRLCVTPETAAHQAPPSLGFSRQHWSGLPFPSPMHESEKWKWSRSVVSDS